MQTYWCSDCQEFFLEDHFPDMHSIDAPPENYVEGYCVHHELYFDDYCPECLFENESRESDLRDSEMK